MRTIHLSEHDYIKLCNGETILVTAVTKGQPSVYCELVTMEHKRRNAENHGYEDAHFNGESY